MVQSGCTAALLAAQRGCPEAVSLLAEAGADLNHRNKAQPQPLALVAFACDY
jgi:hypothetical protein